MKKEKRICPVCNRGYSYSPHYYNKEKCLNCMRIAFTEHYRHIEQQYFNGIVFPELIGTDKQKSWADRIRKHYVMDMLIMGNHPLKVNEMISGAISAAFWIQMADKSIGAINATLALLYNELKKRNKAATP